MAETQFSVPQGDFDLIRYPPTRDPNLRAWDAADELLLSHLDEVMRERPIAKVLIVNDAFGAISAAVSAATKTQEAAQVRFVSDSHVAWIATRQNLDRNAIDPIQDVHMGGAYAVLIKIPKTLALLEAQLVQLRDSLQSTTVIVAAGMTRDIHSSTLELFEQILGPTRTSLAKKKARLIFTELDAALSPTAPEPSIVPLDSPKIELVNHAGVFSAKRLDSGTRLLLENLPATADGPSVIDLGCGNGVLGVAVALADSTAEVTFVDESHLAMRSAEDTFRRAFQGREAGSYSKPTFRVGDCLDGLPGDSADLIVCNPPFHQGRVQGDDVAWKMFTGAKRVLAPGGELWVVGNRHLEYFDKLKRAFGNSQVMASTSKFLVIRAVVSA
ncbi:MAG: methyltransferase [Gemmatimonadales bacterium]|nr:methyltransferase [Gemmatimonadales bacterium]